jgi:hypothetical protein
MDRIAEAGRDFDLALAGAHQIGAAEEEWTAQYGLGRVYRHNGERARALGILQQAIAGIESVRSALGADSRLPVSRRHQSATRPWCLRNSSFHRESVSRDPALARYRATSSSSERGSINLFIIERVDEYSCLHIG